MHFVYRSHYEGPLSRRVRRLPDVTVLSWFQRGWASDDQRSWVEAELGGRVYGLDSIFRAAKKHDMSVPQTTAELRDLLYEHLYVEGDSDFIRLDDHSLRVRTDDDEVELAYFFLDDVAVTNEPGRLAYVMRDSWPLPDDVSEPRPFIPDVPVQVAAPAGTGLATTYAVLLTYYDGRSLARLPPLAFPGVALSSLARQLIAADARVTANWPPELLVLRALVAPDEADLAAALQRCNRWPGFNLNADPWPGLPDDHNSAHQVAMQMVASAEFDDGRRPDASLLRVGEHLAQMAMHCDATFGYQQWHIFDTNWAGSYQDLAQSLLRYANHWDPLDA